MPRREDGPAPDCGEDRRVPHDRLNEPRSAVSPLTSGQVPGRGARPRRVLTLVVLRWRDLRGRTVLFAQWSIGTSLVMATWKVVAALLATASLFWIANAAFSVGLAVAKILVVDAHRGERAAHPRGRHLDPDRWQRQVYRVAGGAVLLIAALYVVSCAAMMVGGGEVQTYDKYTGIAIATLTFTELGLAISGIVSARRRADLLVEVIKLSNLAGALVLLVLTQTALISFANDGGADPRVTGLGGVVFGAAAGLIGLYMLVRPLPPRPVDPTLVEGEVVAGSELDDLKLQQFGTVGDGTRPGARVGGIGAVVAPPRERLLVLPRRHHEVAVIALNGAQELESLESRLGVDRMLAGREPGLQFGAGAGGNGDCVDLHDCHAASLRGVQQRVAVGGLPQVDGRWLASPGGAVAEPA
jgi:hypothetical protein